MNGYTFVTSKGRFYGIPARDLTQDEYEALPPSQQRIVRESDAYAEGIETSSLAKLTRAELEARAESLGVEGPFDRYSNKDQLIAAIEQHVAGKEGS